MAEPKPFPNWAGSTALASLAAIGSVLAASSCCLPVLPFVMAAGVAGTSAFLNAARPYLLAVSVVFIASVSSRHRAPGNAIASRARLAISFSGPRPSLSPSRCFSPEPWPASPPICWRVDRCGTAIFITVAAAALGGRAGVHLPRSHGASRPAAAAQYRRPECPPNSPPHSTLTKATSACCCCCLPLERFVCRGPLQPSEFWMRFPVSRCACLWFGSRYRDGFGPRRPPPRCAACPILASYSSGIKTG